MPVPRHALLISDNPTSAPPRRIVTTLDGTADVRLRPGNYTVESDEPLAFQGKAYQWRHTLDIAAGRDATLELTAANADVEPINLTTAGASPATPGASTSTGPLADDPSTLLAQWHPSVVALWTATTRTSGFVVDANGLIATSQRGVGTAPSVEVQITPSVKVAAHVLVADSVHEVAILRIDPKSSHQCVLSARLRASSEGAHRERTGSLHDRRAAPSAERPQRRDSARGREERVHGRLQSRNRRRGRSRLHGGRERGWSQLHRGRRRRPQARRLSSHRDRPCVCGDGICGEEDEGCRCTRRHAASGRARAAVSPGRYQGRSAPLHWRPEPIPVFIVGLRRHVHYARADSRRAELLGAGESARRRRGPADAGSRAVRHAAAPGLQQLVRLRGGLAAGAARPRDAELVEGFWTKVARGAAQTQGMSMPPIKRLKSGFSRMRAFCGDIEVTPIHPFKLEHSVSRHRFRSTKASTSLTPARSGRRAEPSSSMLYSEKEPKKEDTRVVDPKLLEQIWQDFAPYRALK